MTDEYRSAIKTKRGRHGGGTWVHPYMAMDFLIWAEPRLKMEMYRILFEDHPNIVVELLEWSQHYPKNEKDMSGYIYLIQEGDTSKFKVGFTIDLVQRIESHKISNCNKLKYVAYKYVDNAKEVESQIKNEIFKFNISGEWYKLGDKEILPLLKKYFM